MTFSVRLKIATDEEKLHHYPAIYHLTPLSDDDALIEKMGFAPFEFRINTYHPNGSDYVEMHPMHETYLCYADVCDRVGYSVRVSEFIAFTDSWFGDDITIHKR